MKENIIQKRLSKVEEFIKKASTKEEKLVLLGMKEALKPLQFLPVRKIKPIKNLEKYIVSSDFTDDFGIDMENYLKSYPYPLDSFLKGGVAQHD